MTEQPVTEPGPTININAQALDGTQACIYGCTLRGEHKPHCPCHDTCPDHTDHCNGCAPRPAHDDSLLCGSCYYRRLRTPLRRIPAVYDWLTAQKAGLKATAYDGSRVSGSHDHPLLFNPDIVQQLRVMDLEMYAWAKWVAGQADPGPGPDGLDAPAAATWLEQHAGWISEQVWLVQLADDIRMLEKRARQLAPWQPTRHELPIPCFTCEQQTLVLYGGDDWVTCTAGDCDAIIGWSRYQNLSRAIGNLYAEQRKLGEAG